MIFTKQTGQVKILNSVTNIFRLNFVQNILFVFSARFDNRYEFIEWNCRTVANYWQAYAVENVELLCVFDRKLGRLGMLELNFEFSSFNICGL